MFLFRQTLSGRGVILRLNCAGPKRYSYHLYKLNADRGGKPVAPQEATGSAHQRTSLRVKFRPSLNRTVVLLGPNPTANFAGDNFL